MKRLGTVVQYTAHNELLVRGDTRLDSSLKGFSRFNAAVMDKSVKRIGKVRGIIGPVASPYILVQVNRNIPVSALKDYLNQRVYMK